MATNEWYAQNQLQLSTELQLLREDIHRCLGKQPLTVAENNDTQNPSDFTSGLDDLCTLFQLTAFERKVLVLCAAVQLDGEFSQLCGQLLGKEELAQPNFDVALRLFFNSQWLPFSPQCGLRRWQLVELQEPSQPNLSPIRINETILHFIAGFGSEDTALAALTIPNSGLPTLADSQLAIAQNITELFNNTLNETLLPLVHLQGPEPSAQVAVAFNAAEKLGLPLKRIDAQLLPSDTSALQDLFVRMEREAILYHCLFIFECDDIQPSIVRSVNYLCKRLSAFCMLSHNLTLANIGRDIIKLTVPRPTYDEQFRLWQTGLKEPLFLNGSASQLTAIVDQFDMGVSKIQTVSRQWQIESNTEVSKSGPQLDLLWRLCRKQARADISDLANIIEPSQLHWENLILPEEQLLTLHKILEQVKHRHKVYREWGFADSGAYGLGISALFSGASGTGKTFAARVIASQLKLDIYQIDLSSIVSKYIGETEKNLEKIFTAAENSGAILLFDEADALFGKRSQVSDSKDRYANMEVSYLLQRMESFSGLSILTSNYRSALDQAFIRRLRFIVQFPFPQSQERTAIWKGVFPPKLPKHGIDFDKLARLELPGGIIRSIAINAAFRAANEQELQMAHIREAAQEEYRKTEKTLVNTLVADW